MDVEILQTPISRVPVLSPSTMKVTGSAKSIQNDQITTREERDQQIVTFPGRY